MKRSLDNYTEKISQESERRLRLIRKKTDYFLYHGKSTSCVRGFGRMAGVSEEIAEGKAGFCVLRGGLSRLSP